MIISIITITMAIAFCITFILWCRTYAFIFEMLTYTFSVITLMLIMPCGLCLTCGYLNPQHPVSKDAIIVLYNNSSTKYEATLLIEDWNSKETSFNNYWCRFTLRDNDLIEVNYDKIN